MIFLNIKNHVSNADAIAELSYRNFMEMSSKTADDKFLLQKKIEKWFSDKHLISGFHFIVGSHLVTVHAEALAIGEQNEIMEHVLKTENIESVWDSPTVENMILDF
jgi:kynurenine 3-monooxygenase